MPKFVELEIGPAGSIWVNPYLIRFVGAAENNETYCTIHFAPDQYIPLQERAASVIAKLTGQA